MKNKFNIYIFFSLLFIIGNITTLSAGDGDCKIVQSTTNSNRITLPNVSTDSKSYISNGVITITRPDIFVRYNGECDNWPNPDDDVSSVNWEYYVQYRILGTNDEWEDISDLCSNDLMSGLNTCNAYTKKMIDSKSISGNLDYFFPNIKTNNSDIVIQIRTRAKFWVKGDFDTEYAEGSDSENFLYSTTLQISILYCMPGSIGADITTTPIIKTNPTTYGIYNDKENAELINIPILETESPYIKGEDLYNNTYEKIIMTIWGAEKWYNSSSFVSSKSFTQVEKAKPDVSYNWYPLLTDFYTTKNDFYGLEDGKKLEVTRKIEKYGNGYVIGSCQTNTLNFEVVKALVLSNLRTEEAEKEDINYVCPEESSSAYECGEGTFSIEGNMVDQGINNTIDYGIEYGWEYKTAGSSSWKTVTDNLVTDKSDPKLCLPYSFIKGRTQFRQVVKSTKFNKTIYCDAVGSSDEWQSYVVYNRYSPITAENFTITEPEKICYGESFGENAGFSTVEFLPTKNLVYSSKEGSVKENDFTYLWKKGSQTLTELSNSIHCNDIVTEDITYNVSVTDGCGTTIKLSALKQVKDKPTLSAIAFDVENANITTQEDNLLEIEATKDATIILSITEEGKSGYEYYLVTPSDDLETGPIYQKLSTQWGNPFNPEKITSLIECQTKYGNSSVYLVKKLNGCESEPVYLQIRQIDDIYNNIIIGEGETLIDDIPTIYVCSGSSLPAFSGYTPEGGYTNGIYTYVWESTPDPNSVSWAQIVGTDLTMKDLKSGAISSIETPIYIRRTVYSKSGNGSIKSSSSYRKVMPYEEPTFKVNIKTSGEAVASSPLSLKLCYNQTAYFGYSYSNASFTEQYNVEVPSTTYILTDPETAEVVNSSKNDRYSFNKNLILTAQMEFCGKKFSSENQIAVNVGENLQTSLNDLSLSSCLMEGGEFTASIKDPGSYSYIFSDKNGVILSEKSSAIISIPAANNNNDVTFYISKSDDINGCSQSSTITVAGNKIMKPLENTNLIVTGYAKNQEGDYLICNGEAITITPAAGSVEDSRLSYEWIIDDKSSTFVESSLSNLTFSDYGVKHVIKRITTYRVGTVLCSQIEDVVNVYTREKITSLYVPSASSGTICYEENASLSFNKNALTGGSGDYSYQWSKSSDQDGTYVDCSNGDNITYVDNNLKKDSWYKLTVSDNGCSGGSYIKEFSPVKVTVIPDLSFSASDVSISPTAISLADYETGEPNAFVTVSDDKDMNAVDGLKWGFYMNDALLASKTTQSHQYSISKELADANSEIGFCISRNVTISADKVCVAKFCGAIPVNQGFTSDFTITSEFGSSIKACPTEKISIQTENMPLYNNIELDEKYITYQWRRRIDTLASWVNISGATENVLEVSPNENGNNYVYACQISYTFDGSVHKILSNEITVEGYKKQTSGVVSIMTGEYISNSSNSFEYTLEMYDSWSGKDGWSVGNKEIGYYITFDNNTDDKYFVEYGSNQNIVSIELDGSIHTMQLHIDKLTFIQEISFVLKDIDGNVLYEKNPGDFNSSFTEGITTLYSFDPHASYDENSRKGSISVCKGSEVNVLMEYSGASNGSYQWQYSTDGENWQDLKADNSIMNVNTSSLTYRNENITETTQFRCLATDFCGDVTYSSNVTSIFVNKDISISANEIMMLSSKVVPASTQHVDKISLTIPTDSKSDYYWYYYDDNITGGGNSIEFIYDSDTQVLPKEDGEIGNFYTAGTHTINVYKINKLSGCVSETIPYSYTLYDSLYVSKIINTAGSDTLCKGDNTARKIIYENINGGNPDSEYQITWYYKTASMDYFASLVNGDASTGFDFLINDDYSLNNVKGLTSTTSFYCKVVSPGYPGRDAISNTTTIYVYGDLNAGEINKDQTSLCYGQSSEIENVSIAHGGSGSYSYDWISSVDNGETWSFNTSSSAYASLISTGDLHESTMYKRVVNDLVCNTKDTTNYSKIFRVIDPVIISGSDIRATQIVTIGNKATIQGQSPDFDYLLIKDDGISVIDTIHGQSPYITEPLLAKTNYMVKKINGWGCMSTNDTIITIDVKEPINGGKLMFEKNVDWACSGSDSIGRIINYTEPSGIDLSYKWFYCSSIVDGVCNSPIMGKNSNKQVTTKTVDLDTCGVKFDNTSGKDMVYYFYRLTYGLDETGTQTVVPSDTISLHIAPTLKSVNDNLIDGLAGSLSASQTDYCIGDKGEIINHVLSSTALSAWRDNSFGSLPYGGSLMVYWESADGIVSTASTNGNFSMIEGTESNFTDNAKYFSSFTMDRMDKSKTVRLVINDGCSSLTSPNSDGRQWVFSLEDLDESKFIISPSGIEEGDNVSIKRVLTIDKSSWFSDVDCTDTLAYNNAYVDLTNVTFDTKVYYQPYDDNCKGDAYEVPLTIYRKSNGGKIAPDQTICFDDEYYGFFSLKEASGNNGNFSYKWQYISNLSNSKWITIEGESSTSLSKEIVNQQMKSYDELWFRRIAITDFGREIPSDTIHLNHYDEFKAGIVSFENNYNKFYFCSYDTIPNIIVSNPYGGSISTGSTYSIGWEVKINDEDYFTLLEPTISTFRELNSSWLINQLSLDKSKDNIIQIRAHFIDELCGDVYSDPLIITIYGIVPSPKIYQEKDNCDAQSVTITVEDSINYKYRWFVIDNSGNETWENINVFSKRLDRVNEFSVTDYGIQASNNINGCISDVTYFNLDSLPALSQTELLFSDTICYGYDLTLSLDAASGGSGTKSYQWQFSYDGSSFSDIPSSVNLNLTMKNIKADAWFRRIANDMCQSDTSNAVLVHVHGKIPAPLVNVQDRMCPGQIIKASMSNRSDMIAYADSVSSLGFNYVVGLYEADGFDFSKIYDLNADCYVKPSTDSYLNGFEGVSKDFYAVSSFDWSKSRIINENKCYSTEPLLVTVYNTDELSQENNVIACDNLTPCNGSIVKITGDSAVADGGIASNFSYAWLVSKDGVSWDKILLATGTDIELAITDTTLVKRLASNGCDTLASNVITFVGKKLDSVDYVTDLGLSIITTVNSDSSMVVNLKTSSHDIASDFLTSGDGDVPSLVYGSNILPYDAQTYKDSLLSITRAEGCASSYRVSPLYGGRIYMDGDGKVCAGSDIPSIMATKIEGGYVSPSYQWQYKNEFVNEFIDLTDATSESYTPQPISVKTWYRRLTSCGEYSSVSNEISVEIISIPEVGYIRPSVTKEFLDSYGLESNEFMVQKTASLKLDLLDSVKNASEAYWSYNSVDPEMEDEWTMSQSVIDLNKDEQSLSIEDSSSIVYYRMTASNVCGSSSSPIFKVVTINTPIIFDDEITIESAKCKNDVAFIRCYDNNQKVASSKYIYTYEGYDGYAYTKMFGVESPYLGEETHYGVYFKDVTESFSIKVTRIEVNTGASSSRTVDVVYEPLVADFNFAVAGTEYSRSDSPVDIEQGARVQFNNKSENATSFYWELLKPLNTDYSTTHYGLYSYLENPVCYFYNKGEYEITFIAKNAAGCADTIKSIAVNIPASAFRSTYVNDAEFVAEGESEERYILSPIFVYPSAFSDVLFISYEGNDYSFTIYNENGAVIRHDKGFDVTKLNTSGFAPGAYVIEVNDQIFKLIKY